MAAPRHPRTAAATAGKIRKAQERKAAELRAAGWTCIPPETRAETITAGELREREITEQPT